MVAAESHCKPAVLIPRSLGRNITQIKFTVLELKYAVLKVKSQLEFLVDLCGIDRAIAASSGFGQAVSACPKGLRLLTRLYDAARQAAGLLHEPLAIAVFAAGTGPFLRSVFVALGRIALTGLLLAGLLRF